MKFKKRDLMLIKILPLPGKDLSTWASNYKSPYIVKKAFSSESLVLTRRDGEDLIRPMNFYFIKKYYS